jgi:hypothetical protein
VPEKYEEIFMKAEEFYGDLRDYESWRDWGLALSGGRGTFEEQFYFEEKVANGGALDGGESTFVDHEAEDVVMEKALKKLNPDSYKSPHQARGLKKLFLAQPINPDGTIRLKRIYKVYGAGRGYAGWLSLQASQKQLRFDAWEGLEDLGEVDMEYMGAGGLGVFFVQP